MDRLRALLLLSLTVSNCSILEHITRHHRDLSSVDLDLHDVTERSAEPFPAQLHLTIRTPGGETENLTVRRNADFNPNLPVEISENGDRKRHVTDDDKAEYLSERAAFHVRATRRNARYERSFTGVLEKAERRYFIERAADRHRVVSLPPVSDHTLPEGVRQSDGVRAPPTRTRYSRRKAGKGLKLYPNIMVIIDYGIYQKFGGNESSINRIKDFYGIVFAGMVQRYKRVNYRGMTITPRLRNMVILTTEADDEAVLGHYKDGDSIGAHSSLLYSTQFFNQYRVNTTVPKITREHIDHAMTFTNHRLYTYEKGVKNYGVVGMAYIGRMCTTYSVSVIEDDFTLKAISTSAHELGHSLGAEHDEDVVESCINDYIMSPFVTYGTPQTYQNRYLFSTCSLEYIYNYTQSLNKMNNNCMVDRARVDLTILRAQNQVPGLKYNRDRQCEIATGITGAKFCGQKTNCRFSKCRDPVSKKCKVHSFRHALYGTVCGVGRFCIRGLCQEARSL